MTTSPDEDESRANANSIAEAIPGIGLEPGAKHYRAFVGPPEDYDLIAAMTFGLLTALGLRQHHSILDIGCGSLRIGRMLIPYLNPTGYTGMEPSQWLIEEGIDRECGRDQIAIKKPNLVIGARPDAISSKARFDFALAQSIFSHADLDTIRSWIHALSRHLEDDGAFIFTFIDAEADNTASGWTYPECVSYRRDTLELLSKDAGFRFHILDWRHPRQTWALCAREGFRTSWIEKSPLSWNTGFDAGRWR